MIVQDAHLVRYLLDKRHLRHGSSPASSSVILVAQTDIMEKDSCIMVGFFPKWWVQERKWHTPQLATQYVPSEPHTEDDSPELVDDAMFYITVYVKVQQMPAESIAWISIKVWVDKSMCSASVPHIPSL